MPLLRAAFMEPLACCIRALDRAPVQAGDTVVVVGVGAIGLLFVPLVCHAGGTVIAADINAGRLELAKDRGAVEAVDAAAGGVPDACMSHSAGRGADIVILTATTSNTLSLALASVRDGGTIVPFGVKLDFKAPMDLWQFYRREISMVSSYSATPAGLASAMSLLSKPGFDLERTISHALPLSRAAEGFDLLHEGRGSKVIITAD
jgi:L-iditol 2-dehydrogenase